MFEDDILANSAYSEWLHAALRAALTCDPVCAANEAQLLACVLMQRADRLVSEPEPKPAEQRPSAASSTEEPTELVVAMAG